MAHASEPFIFIQIVIPDLPARSCYSVAGGRPIFWADRKLIISGKKKPDWVRFLMKV